MAPPAGKFIPLEPVRQPRGKTVHAWAVKGDFDPAALKSNTFSIEWPPKSGRQQEFPEVDRAAWLSIPAAKRKILSGQVPFLTQLQERLGVPQETHEGSESTGPNTEVRRQPSLCDDDQ